MGYWIKDINLADKGEVEIKNALRDMPGLVEIEKKYKNQQPLKGLKLSGCVWVTYETAAFAWLLKKLGADVRWCSCNKYASIDEACAFLVKEGVHVFAKRGETDEEFMMCIDQTWRHKNNKGEDVAPDYLIDDGSDQTTYLHAKHPEIMKQIKGITEQTTCGVTLLKKLADSEELMCPAINVNDSVTKSKFDNLYGSRESFIEGFQKAINMQIAGRKFVIFGYGEVGKGIAFSMKGVGANVSIVEIDPILAMQAQMEGFEVLDRETASKTGDVFISATGCIKTIDREDIDRMKSGAILGNMGHGNMEVNTKYLNSSEFEIEEIHTKLHKYTDKKGRERYLLCEGYLVNATGGTGHPPRVMSMTFTNHFVALLSLIELPDDYPENKIYLLTTKQEEEIARINFPELQDKLNKLTEEQAQYLGVDVDGPYKRSDYRY